MALPRDLAQARTLRLEAATEELLTPPAVATLLGVSPPTVYSALRRRRSALEHLRTPGGQVRIRPRAVLAYCHRAGVPVPSGLLRSPAALLVHPDRRTAARLARLLAPVAATGLETDLVDALVRIGADRPAAVLVSARFGDDLVERLPAAIEGADGLGYAVVVRLVPGREIGWSGGPVPSPVDAGESSGRGLTSLLGALLGTGPGAAS